MPSPPPERQVTPRFKEPPKAKAKRAGNSTLPPRGARSARLKPALDRAYDEVDRRDGGCQFHLVDPTHRCPRNALLHHDHLWGRNVRPDLRERAWAIVLLCSVAHDAVTKDSELHRQLRSACLVERITEWLACPA